MVYFVTTWEGKRILPNSLSGLIYKFIITRLGLGFQGLK